MPPLRSVAARALELTARERDPALLVAALHDLAREAVSASVSVVLERAADGQGYLVTSASGLETSPLDRWGTSSRGAALLAQALVAARPLMLSALDEACPELRERLLTPAAVLARVSLDTSGALLVLGIEPGVGEVDGDAPDALAHAFALALETARRRSDGDLERDLRQAMLEVSRSGELPLDGPGVSAFCAHVARLLGADGAELWHLDREAQELVLAASSDGTPRGARRLPAADQESAPGAGLARNLPTLVQEDDPHGATTALSLSVPLRGRRRALGALVLRGLRLEPGGDADVLARAEHAGRQLSALLESGQLLDDVVRSRRQLENVFDSLVDLVVVCDTDGRVIEANRAFAARVGTTPRALTGRSIGELVGGDLASLAAGAGAKGVEVTDGDLGGTFVATSAPLAGASSSPAGYVLVARDVTEARRLDREREALEARLAQTEKLLALGQFVAGIAHELNNPLQGVLGHVELLRASPAMPAALKRDLGLVHREADRAARIVRHLLVFAGSGRLSVRRVNPNAILTRVLRLRARAHRAAGVAVERSLDPDLPRVSADGMLLQQALLNLVLNAEQAMGGGGTLVVRTHADAEGGVVRIEVEDSGPGLAPDVLARLFEPFFTTKEVGAGTGLGLAIVFGIVRAHGGTIEGDNRTGGGARFTVTLPVEPAGRTGAAASR